MKNLLKRESHQLFGDFTYLTGVLGVIELSFHRIDQVAGCDHAIGLGEVVTAKTFDQNHPLTTADLQAKRIIL